MANTTQVAAKAAPIPPARSSSASSGSRVSRSRPIGSLRPGTARRRAFDAALAEIEAGHEEPEVEWRQQYSLMLGLERLLAEDEPSWPTAPCSPRIRSTRCPGTLTALIAEAERQNGNGHGCRCAGTRTSRGATEPSDEDDSSDDDRGRATTTTRTTTTRTTSQRTRTGPEVEPSRSNGTGEVEEDQLPEQPEDPGAARRFWFEHATGAGKTVAALGFVEASRTGGILILTHRRNLVDQFLGELRDRGYRDRISPAAAARQGPRRRPGNGRDLPVVRPQRRQHLGRVHDRDLRRGAHGARREDERLDPPLAGADLHRHDRDRRADRAARRRPLPDADEPLRPRPGRSARRDRAAALRSDPAGHRTCARSPRCRCAKARSTRTSIRKSWPHCSTRARSTPPSPTSTACASSTCRASSTPPA